MVRTLVILILISALSACGKSEHTYQGYVEGENIYLASPYSGTLTHVFVLRGEPVKKGKLLFQLDSNPQALQIQQAKSSVVQARHIYHDMTEPKRPPEIAAIEAQIAQTETQIRLADLRVHRYQTLYAKHALDKDSVDAAVEHYNELGYLKAQFEDNLELAKLGSRESQLKAQKAQISMLYTKQKEIEWQISQKSIVAPKDGVIFDTYFKQGEFVDTTKPIAALLASEDRRIEFFVPASALPSLRVGKHIAFDCDGCSKKNQAQIQYISPEAEYVPPLVYSRENMDKLVFRVKASIHDADQFKPGQPVVVTVPADA